MGIAAKLDTMMERLRPMLAEAAGPGSTEDQPYNAQSVGLQRAVTANEKVLTAGVVLSDDERKSVVEILNHSLAGAGFATSMRPEPWEYVAKVHATKESKGAVTVGANYHITAGNMQALSEAWDGVVEISRKLAKQADMAQNTDRVRA